MFRRSIFFPALLAVILLLLLIFAAGCGRDSYFLDDHPAPLSADVIIIGDSLAALTAALEASQNGASVLVFYNQPNVDRWLFDEGALAFGEVEEDGEEDAATGLYETLAAFGAGGGQRWHYARLAENAGPDMAWLAGETGLEMVGEQPYLFRPDNLSAAQFYSRLTASALNEGVRFLPGTQLLGLTTESGGRAVTGIRYSSATEKPREAYAPAVILADGGILGFDELMEELAPAVSAASWRFKQEGVGWQAAMDAGLDLVVANLFAYAPAVRESTHWVKARWPDGALLVAGNEIIPANTLAEAGLAAELLKNRDSTGYLVVAESQIGRDYDLNWPRYEGIDAFMEAHRIDLPLLRRRYLQPWEVFRGIQVKAVAEYCLGGIAVNENGEALRGGEPVSGLYAAGEITGGLHGWGLMPGAAFSESVAWGRHVGRNAARLALQ